MAPTPRCRSVGYKQQTKSLHLIKPGLNRHMYPKEERKAAEPPHAKWLIRSLNFVAGRRDPIQAPKARPGRKKTPSPRANDKLAPTEVNTRGSVAKGRKERGKKLLA